MEPFARIELALFHRTMVALYLTSIKGRSDDDYDGAGSREDFSLIAIIIIVPSEGVEPPNQWFVATVLHIRQRGD